MSAHIKNLKRTLEQELLRTRHRRLQDQKDKAMSNDRTVLDDLIERGVKGFERFAVRADEAIEAAAERVAILVEEAKDARKPKLAVVEPIHGEETAEPTAPKKGQGRFVVEFSRVQGSFLGASHTEAAEEARARLIAAGFTPMD